jgi:hypothetical protein
MATSKPRARRVSAPSRSPVAGRHARKNGRMATGRNENARPAVKRARSLSLEIPIPSRSRGGVRQRERLR